MGDTGVCVIIAAYRASATIGRAVTSALAEPEAVEVIVVDDASPDGTADTARAADDGSGRLRVVRMPENGGPSRARNHAIAISSAPLIAVLDADDFFLPGRFAALGALADWDFAADNIAMIDEADGDRFDVEAIARHRIAPRTLTAAQFVRGSITDPHRQRGELAFLKPVMRRRFLDEHALWYADDMRLAEDYDLYLRALMAGARFRIAPSCHYVAVERQGSLSHHHSVNDLARFAEAIERQRAAAFDPALRQVLGRHGRQTRRRLHHRMLLQRRREIGLGRALLEQANTPRSLAGAILDIAKDKVRPILPQSQPLARSSITFLIDASLAVER